jgi:Tol biopolymer transport system component
MKVAVVVVIALLGALPAAAGPGGNGMIAFASKRTYGDGRVDRGGIHLVAPDGSSRTLLTPGVAAAEQPTWSPDGSRLAYLVDEENESPPRGGLWLVNANGGSRVRLFAGQAGGHVWSPDGTRIAFDSGNRVHVARVADGQVTNVGAGVSASWSPDGDQLAYVSAGIEIVDTATWTNVRKLPLADVVSAMWSPDGAMIAFVRRLTGPPLFAADLSVIRPDGSGRTTVWDRLYSPSRPTWSPDASRLLLDDPGGLSHSGSATFLHPREVLVAAADGSSKTVVTRGRRGFSPAWSPDGTKVAFTTERGTSAQIFIANADGTCPTQLTRSASASRVIDHAHTPSWQPGPNAATSPPIRCADLGLLPRTRTGVGALRSVKEFLFTLANEGNESATAIRFVIEFPQTLVAQGASDSTCRYERRKITCEHPRIEVGTTPMTVGFFARLVRPGRGAIRVRVTGAQPDGDRSNNEIRFVHEVSRCTRLGADRSDTLVGTPRADVICGNGGADRLLGRAGADELLAGAGSDTVVPGLGRDVVNAGGGADFALARDGAQDNITCGSGRDFVVSDRRDTVGRDCERVVRS